jgi:hypothetical protein
MPAECGDELFEYRQRENKKRKVAWDHEKKQMYYVDEEPRMSCKENKSDNKLEHKTGEYYASLAEKDRAEFHKRIENSDLPKDKKIEYIAVFDKGFDLGFACAKQYCDKDMQNLTAELTSMTKEEFDSYAKLHKLLTENELLHP